MRAGSLGEVPSRLVFQADHVDDPRIARSRNMIRLFRKFRNNYVPPQL
jgi:hypothetical protein